MAVKAIYSFGEFNGPSKAVSVAKLAAIGGGYNDTSNDATNAIRVYSSSGRHGGYAVSLRAGNYSPFVSLPAPDLSASSTVVVGANFFHPSEPGLATATDFFCLLDGSGNKVFHLQLTSLRTLIATVGATTVLETSTFQVPLNSWTHLELKVTLDTGTGGSYEVRAEGTTILSGSGVTTSAGATPTQVRLGRPGVYFANIVNFLWSDVYVLDGTGVVANDFLGPDTRVETILPDGAGTTTQWSPSTGDNYACVDEADDDADASYVSPPGDGSTDTYAFSDLALSFGTIYAIQPCASGRVESTGNGYLQLAATYNGGPIYLGLSVSISSTTYAPAMRLLTTAPDGKRWTISRVNAAEFGYSAEVVGPGLRVTQILVSVLCNSTVIPESSRRPIITVVE